MPQRKGKRQALRKYSSGGQWLLAHPALRLLTISGEEPGAIAIRLLTISQL
jgi:hypothetical protein